MDAALLLSSDDLRLWRQCPRHFWLRRHDRPGPRSPEPAADASAEAAVVHGPAPGEALRASFPGAVAIAPPVSADDWERALQQTAACIDAGVFQSEGGTLLGACLVSDDGALVRIDVLSRGAHGLRLFKVRHATVGDQGDVDAVALWAHVAARCALRLQSVGLLLVDTAFLYPGHGCYAGLFREVDLAPVLGALPVSDWLVAMRRCERSVQPRVEATSPCTQNGGCEHIHACLASDTGAARPPAPQAQLEIVGRELAAELRHEGHADLHSVPLQRLPDARHRRAAQAVQRGAPVLEPALAALLQAQPWPRHFLRLDTIGFAVPVWPATRPYQVLPFQWSCDVEAVPGQLQRHAFLADASGDPRRAFAESLLRTLGSAGAVFAYNAGFERNRIRELARLFEDLGGALDALLPRIVDLFQVARAHYYHPSMCGSWSFKSICRALAPDLDVERIDWPGEPSAQAVFARSLQRGVDARTLAGLQSALREHGQRGTEALRRMVTLFEGGPPT
jgi:hypothetical protein